MRACATELSCFGNAVNCSTFEAIPMLRTPDPPGLFAPVVGNVGVERYRCLAALNGDCGRIIDCLGYGPATSSTTACSDSGYTCDGSNLTWISCDQQGHQTTQSWDCRALDANATCSSWRPGWAPNCGAGLCQEAGTTCRGNRYESCDQYGFLMSFDCGAGAFHCDLNAGGCAGTGAPCAITSNSCDGHFALQCVGGSEVRIDCSALASGASCFGALAGPKVGTAFCGYGDACLGQGATCDGSILHYCAGVRTDSLDCRSIGFRGCLDTGTIGAFGTGHCVQ